MKTIAQPHPSRPFALVLAAHFDDEARLERLDVLLARLRPAWTVAARCRGRFAEIDFTDGHHKAAALALCDRCPVQAQCLAWAFELNDQDAVMGGTTPQQRRAMQPPGGIGVAITAPQRGARTPLSAPLLSGPNP